MRRANSGKVEFYKTMITIATDLIEELTGSKMDALDPSIEPRLERALEFSNTKELKELHLRLDEMLAVTKKKGIFA